jgi:hypothetical protein
VLSPRWRLCWSLCVACACLSARAPVACAAESEAHTLLQKGIALQRDASWNASIAALEKARAAGLATAPERAECAFYLAAAYVAINSDGAAKRELGVVLDERPSFEPPPYTSPKLASLFGEVTRERSRRTELEARPPRTLAPDETHGSGLELTFDAQRGLAPIYGVVHFRMRGAPHYEEAPLTRHGAGSLIADVRPAQPGVLEYYADALGPSGPLRAGSMTAPLELPIGTIDPPRRGHRIGRTSKLVWLAVPLGVVLGAATGLGLYFGLRARH